MYLAPGHSSPHPVPTSVAVPGIRSDSPARPSLHGSAAPTRDPGIPAPGPDRSRSPAASRRHEPPDRRPGPKGSGRGRVGPRIRNPHPTEDIGRQRQCFTWWTGLTTQPTSWPMQDPLASPAGPMTISRTPAQTSLPAEYARLRNHQPVSHAPQMTVTICLTCGQPILQPTDHQQIPGTQILPASAPHHELAERIGWRCLQTALRYTAHGQQDRARDLLHRRWHHHST